mgnify:CR=1 FL=1
MEKNIYRALNTTLIYIERGEEYLMLHRTKKKNDMNHDKYIGVGGHLEQGESPEECILREVPARAQRSARCARRKRKRDSR